MPRKRRFALALDGVISSAIARVASIAPAKSSRVILRPIRSHSLSERDATFSASWVSPAWSSIQPSAFG